MVRDKVIIERLLTESSLSRIQHWIETKEIATISAYRNVLEHVTPQTDMGGLEIGHVFSQRENRERQKELKAALLQLGYGVTEIGGHYIESVGSEDEHDVWEHSLFVVNLHDDSEFFNNLFDLSENYNQDSFIIKKKNSDKAFAVGTNTHDWPGYGNRVDIGKIHYMMSSQFISLINNKSFAFMTDDDLAKSAFDTEDYSFNARKGGRKRLLYNETMNEAIEYGLIDDDISRHTSYGRRPIYECAKPVLRRIGRVR